MDSVWVEVRGCWLKRHTLLNLVRGQSFRPWWHPQDPDAVQWFRHAVPFEGVSAEAVDVLRLVRAQARQSSLVNLQSLRYQRLQRPCQRHDVVENKQVRDKMVVLDHLSAVHRGCFPPAGGLRRTRPIAQKG